MSLFLLCLFLLVTLVSTNPELPVLSWQPDSLIMASADIPSFYEFDVSDKTSDVTELRELPHGYNRSKAISYDSSTATLFWTGTPFDVNSGERTMHVMSTVNNSGVINTLHISSHFIYALAVDSGRQLLFIGTAYGEDSVGVMTTRGDNYRVLSRVHYYCYMSPYDLALDTNQEIIYVACYFRLLRMTYRGFRLSILDRGSQMWNVALDQPTGTLFYNDNRIVKTLNPYNVSTALSFQMDFEKEPYSVINHGSYLFVSYVDDRNIHIVDVHDEGIISTIHDIPGNRYHWWPLVYIPPDE